ncbi:AAA-like domain-containing protein [Crocosphaera sp. UHCC 0190]|uniref:AAA-like domain-containing protein n=1 Tax=Crocosphaera sp. UHCC 0190 TaxID=3110246 RepID=UPI002B200F85|nr:AAA-like domain-containing protein [Crocosphaera sp. UHCC 0190]MEA5510392.1 AAA-like domain-containing protein [Crocosphaera sp. UHCC 0190]
MYSDHLQRQLYNLQRQDSELLETLEKVVFAPEAIELDLLTAIKLQSFGLVNLKGNEVMPSCRLYQQYFQQYFQGDNVINS